MGGGDCEGGVFGDSGQRTKEKVEGCRGGWQGKGQPRITVDSAIKVRQVGRDQRSGRGKGNVV